MKMITCKLCGKEFNYYRERTKFCSRDCYNKHREMLVAQGINAYQQSICRHNVGVACEEQNCDTCGWNPAVAQKRMERITKELG